MISLPEAERPEEVERAAAVLEARERDLTEAEQAVREARAGLDAARAEDRAAYAAARDAGEDDPGPKHFEAARANLEDCERKLGGEQLRAKQAQAALHAALAEHHAGWGEVLERAQERADAASLRALEKFELAERIRAELRGARAWVRRPSSSAKPAGPIPSPIKRNLNGDLFSLTELVAGVRGAIEHSTVEAERQRAVAREAAEAQAEQLREQRRAMTEGAIGR